jgi:hypothetical protein
MESACACYDQTTLLICIKKLVPELHHIKKLLPEIVIHIAGQAKQAG